MRLFFLFCIAIFPLHALYNGNPSFPMMPEEGLFLKKEGWISAKAGYEWDDVFDRKLIAKKRQTSFRRGVEEFEMMGNFGSLTVGFRDRVELYSLLGSCLMRTEYHPHRHLSLKMRTENHFGWEVGGRGILAYWGDTQLGVDAKYFQSNPEIDSLRVDGASFPVGEGSARYREWQVGLGVSQRFKYLIPYLGFKYSDVRAKFHKLESLYPLLFKTRFTMKNNSPIGLFLGVGFCLNYALNFNFEVRLIDETAITASADLRF